MIIASRYTYAATALTLDARAGIEKPAIAHATSIVRADVAMTLRVALGNLTPEQRDAGLREYWRNIYAFVTPSTVAARYDPSTGEETLTLDGKAAMDWSGGYETDGTSIGYTADFTREPGPDRDAPFAVAFPSYTRFTETILLPDGGKGFTLDDAAFDRTIAGIAYHRTGTLKDGTVRLERTIRSVAPEFPASEAVAAQETLTALGRKAIYVRPPDTLGPAIGATSPVQEQAAAAYKLLAAQHSTQAVAAFEAVVRADPAYVGGYVGRGLAYAQLGRLQDARADLDKAVSLSPQNPAVLVDRGSLALSQGDHDEAISDAAVAIALAPTNAAGYVLRARTYADAGDYEKVRADAERAITLAPADVESYLLLANASRNSGHPAESVAVAGRLTAANLNDDYAHVVAGAIYGRFHRDDDARREFDRAIAIKPTVYAYLTRLEYRPRNDVKGRQADIDAARRLDPADPAVASQQAMLDDRAGHPEKAIPVLSQLLGRRPLDVDALVSRGIAYAHLGRSIPAEADFATARKAAQGATMLNEMCWRKAAANVALQSALVDCDASLAAQPANAATLDSRGFVLLRLKRWDDAIAAYDRALAVRPSQAASLYGRSLAKTGKGDAPGAAADRRAALKLDPDVEDRFDGYGLGSES